MAVEVKAWRAEDGTLHGTEREAATANVTMLVRDLFSASELQPPEDVRRFLIERREDVIRVLSIYHRCHPANSREEAPSEAQEGPAESMRGEDSANG